MAIDLKQSLKLGQQLLMTPQLQQAIKLLQLSRVELEEFVTQQLAENPVLEEGVVESSEERVQLERVKEKSQEQVIDDHMSSASNLMDNHGEERGSESDWESYYKQGDRQGPTASTQNRLKDDEFPSHENLAREGSLNDHLIAQIGEIDLDEKERLIASAIVGNIDERGYLEVPLEDLAQSLNVSVDAVDDILDVIQRLDPMGVGARDLKECLLLQLKLKRLKNGIVEKLVEKHLPDLETRNFQLIAKSLKIPLDAVIENVQIIAELEPVPGRQFGIIETQFVVPDVYIFKVSGEWIVSLNEEGLPHLRVSEIYEEMLQSMAKAADSKDKDYISDKLKSATWLIKSIQQRQRTILRVTEKLVERQQAFFEYGIEHLKPMVLRDIAEDIGMHESTISRVTNNKFVHTPQGIFELKYFFNSSVSRSGGDNLASASVKQIISEAIRKENPKKPLADQKIVDMLDERGIQLARRTVAKYREQLGIPPSSKRKKYF